MLKKGTYTMFSVIDLSFELAQAARNTGYAFLESGVGDFRGKLHAF